MKTLPRRALDFSASGSPFPSRRLSPRWKSAATSLLIFATLSAAAAVVPTEWQHRQTLPVTAAGLTKVVLPAATFDAAQASLADLRLLDASGQEVPYLLDRDLSVRGYERASAFNPRSFRTSADGDTSQLLIETGTAGRLDALELETPLPFFLKAAHVDVSSDGATWESLGAAVPIFRQFGAEQLRLPLGRRAFAFIRVTLDDVHTRPMTFTGAKLLPAPVRPEPPPLAPVGARITHHDEFAGETVLTVMLDGAHVPLAGLTIEAKDVLFMRRVTVAVRDVQGEISSERLVGSGTIYRIALEGSAARAELEVPLNFTPATRELLVHIHNGDSPPLGISGVSASQHPMNLLFLAAAPGTYTMLSGNPQATAPSYDLAAFAGEMRGAAGTAIIPGDLQEMPDYHPRESLASAPLPDVPLTGAPLDTQDWTQRRPIQLVRAGVQELELDPAALAQARPDFADLRVLHDGNQIPFVLEQPALARSLMLTPAAVPDPKRPGVSVWQVKLPQAHLPLRRLVLNSNTALFQRQFRVFEKLTGSDGRAYVNTLATGAWSRTPEPGVPETRTFDLDGPLRTDTIWIETDNGDNPPIVLGNVQVVYPVVRLIFKVGAADGFSLAYGNAAANFPRYDLSLVAVRLLTSSRNVAVLGTAGTGVAVRQDAAGLNGGYLFWGALGLVVIVLLVVVAKLLPKPAPPK